MKGKFQVILFVLKSHTNRINWDFPLNFIQPVGLLCPLVGGGSFGLVLGGTGHHVGNAFLEKSVSDLVGQSSR